MRTGLNCLGKHWSHLVVICNFPAFSTHDEHCDPDDQDDNTRRRRQAGQETSTWPPRQQEAGDHEKTASRPRGDGFRYIRGHGGIAFPLVLAAEGTTRTCFPPGAGTFRDQPTYAYPLCFRDIDEHSKSLPSPNHCYGSGFL